MRNYDFMIDGGYVDRYHTQPTINRDTVGHHSFNVACAIMALRPDASAALLKAALLHDVAEHVVGDMPAPAKRAMPDYGQDTFREVFSDMEEKHMLEAGIQYPELSMQEGWVLRLADALDGMRFCIHERAMGNKKIDKVFWNFHNYCTDLLYGEGWGPESQLVKYAHAGDLLLFSHLAKEWNYACK